MTAAAKSHWRMAYRAFKKALKVSLQDVKQCFKAYRYRHKIQEDLDNERRFFIKLETVADNEA